MAGMAVDGGGWPVEFTWRRCERESAGPGSVPPLWAGKVETVWRVCGGRGRLADTGKQAKWRQHSISTSFIPFLIFKQS